MPNRMIYPLRGLVLPAMVLLLFACGNGRETTNELPLKLARRSVLDQKIRMLTLQYGDDRFAAYDLEQASLYKVWRGGVLWNGAAFNNLKTVQPESYGNIYWDIGDGEAVRWEIGQDQERLPAKLDFRAYRLEDNGITIEYQLQDESARTALIIERPAFRLQDSITQFERIFTLIESDADLTVYLDGQELLLDGVMTHVQSRGTLPAAAPPPLPASTNNSQYWLERSGCNTCHHEAEQEIGPSYAAIAGRYDNHKENVASLVRKVQEGGAGVWGSVPMIPHPNLDEGDLRRMVQYILSLRPKEEGKTRSQSPEAAADQPAVVPGFGAPVPGVHPALQLINFRPRDFRPRVGGMAFLPDGRLLVSTWDSTGAVYALSGVESGDSSQVTVTPVATGLSEPLGLTTVGEDIFVLQKHELTQLIDRDGDGVTEEYRQISDAFEATPDFHEYSYGLLFHEGAFYGGLGLAMRLMSHELQLTDRGTIFRITQDGASTRRGEGFEKIAFGLRQPNGMVFSPEGELFVAENQGQWVPACKIIHIQEGQFYGCEYGMGDRYAGLTESPPAVWLPQDEIGNSPSQPLFIPSGPYRGQMIHGEVTHGGIKRVFLEKVDGQYQGCVFRFTQGLEAGINRMAWGPDGALYVGGVGMNGNWAHNGNQYGLQKLVFTDEAPFEVLAVRSQPDGFELEFTEAVSDRVGDLRTYFRAEQWYYEATPAYGGPKLDLQQLSVGKVTVSADGKRCRLSIPGLKEGYVVYLKLDPRLKSAGGRSLWSGDIWYTLNRIPTIGADTLQ